MPLDRFGYTRTQDTVYKALLRRQAATGYAIARDTNLARANVYQALDSLVAAGLATAEGDRPVTYSATSGPETLELLASRLERELADLATELGSRQPARRARRGSQPAFESIDGPGALTSAAEAAVSAAGREVLAVVGPWVEGLFGALETARGRGLGVKMVSLGSPGPAGAILRLVPDRELTAYWGGLPLVLVCDRAHAVCGVISGADASGLETRSPGLVPFLRHLLRRELAAAAGPRPS